jgi:hypothetical protein
LLDPPKCTEDRKLRYCDHEAVERNRETRKRDKVFRALFLPALQAFFLDFPALIDSSWRYIAYHLGAECDYTPGCDPSARPLWKKPPFWFFVITLFFVSYGPSWGWLCAIAPQGFPDLPRKILVVVIIIASVALAAFFAVKTRPLIQERFKFLKKHDQHCSRCATVH